MLNDDTMQAANGDFGFNWVRRSLRLLLRATIVWVLPVAAASAQQTLDEVSVRIWGDTGEEQARLWVDNRVVGTRQVTNGATTWTVFADVDELVEVEFYNNGTSANGRDKNLWVNWVEVNGTRIETESRDVFSTGTYTPATNCAAGFKQLEILHCNGRFSYAFGDILPTSTPAPTNGCIDAGGYVRSALGDCVGVEDGVRLSNFKPFMRDTDVHRITQRGQVVEGKRIVGCVVIAAPDVEFRNNTVECYASRDINNSPSPYPGNNGPVTVLYSAPNALVEHNTLVCKKKFNDVAACDYGVYIHGQNSVARFNDVSGAVDGFDASHGARIEYNYVHHFGTAWEEWRADDPNIGEADWSHADGVQVYDRDHGGIIIRGNHFDSGLVGSNGGDRESGLQAVLAHQYSGVGGGAIRIEQNLVTGRWPSLRLACLGGADCTIADNTINSYYRTNTNAINVDRSHSSTRVSCNVFTDGQMVQDNRVFGGTPDNSIC